MPEARELEMRLAALRQDIAEAKRAGTTPSHLRKLQTECWQLWAAIDRYKYAHALDLVSTRQQAGSRQREFRTLS
jgi:hypothetical protein